MSKKTPPTPPDNRSPKGTGSDTEQQDSDMPQRPERENFDQQGRTANTKQNTRKPGSHGSRAR